uniref:Tyrosine protein kinase Fes:Fps n=1 Tax=Echinococcus granulosus TaxID=6210 RepID=A0A068WA21_ECHGR|nr:tyrosine protein kinase Fes:Fps [Echinococcus granulosus]
MLPVILLHVAAVGCVRIEVPVFKDYFMPCNISALPARPRMEDIYWFQDGRLNRGVNDFLLPQGEIPFEGISPSAAGVYRCCYNGSMKISCAEVVHLIVKAPRPNIFQHTLLNITPHIFPNNVYWLPQMLTTPLEVEMTTEPLEFNCFYFAQSSGPRRPHVAWYFNDLYPEDRRFESPIQEDDKRYVVKTMEITCEEDYMQHSRSRCFKSTLMVRLPSDLRRRTVYTCEVQMFKADGLVENQLSVDYRLRSDNRRDSDWIYGLTDIERFGEDCDRFPNESPPLEALIQELNACKRNSFLRLWVSPVNSEKLVQATCSRPVFLVFNELLQLIRLPPDPHVIRLFFKVENITSVRSPFDGILKRYGKFLLKSDVTTLRVGGKKHHSFDTTLQGNVSLDCQPSHVVVCVYGPLVQMKLVHMTCSPSDRHEGFLLICMVVGGLVVATLLFVGLYLWRRQCLSRRHYAVWKTVEAYTSSLLLERRLCSPPLPTPLPRGPNNFHREAAQAKKAAALEYVKLGKTRWPLSARSLRLEEQIACGSYGDVFKGVLLTSPPGQSHVLPRPIVAKVLNDVYLKDHVLEFANEVAILRLIGAHPTIIQFLGCAHRTNLSNRPVLVTEYASHGTLLGYLRALRPNRDTVLGEVVMTYWWTRARALVADLYSFVIDIASALVYLEEIAVVHSDVAARNVLLTASLTAKLNDFGLACVIPHGKFVELPATKKVPVRWSAPEVLQENRRHARSDVWSFGVLLWETFAVGETPYEDLPSESAVGVFVGREGGRLPRPTLASGTLYSLMTACWAASVDARPDFRTLLEDLSREAALERKKSEDANLLSHVGEDLVLFQWWRLRLSAHFNDWRVRCSAQTVYHPYQTLASYSSSFLFITSDLLVSCVNH